MSERKTFKRMAKPLDGTFVREQIMTLVQSYDPTTHKLTGTKVEKSTFGDVFRIAVPPEKGTSQLVNAEDFSILALVPATELEIQYLEEKGLLEDESTVEPESPVKTLVWKAEPEAVVSIQPMTQPVGPAVLEALTAAGVDVTAEAQAAAQETFDQQVADLEKIGTMAVSATAAVQASIGAGLLIPADMVAVPGQTGPVDKPWKIQGFDPAAELAEIGLVEIFVDQPPSQEAAYAASCPAAVAEAAEIGIGIFPPAGVLDAEVTYAADALKLNQAYMAQSIAAGLGVDAALMAGAAGSILAVEVADAGGEEKVAMENGKANGKSNGKAAATLQAAAKVAAKKVKAAKPPKASKPAKTAKPGDKHSWGQGGPALDLASKRLNADELKIVTKLKAKADDVFTIGGMAAFFKADDAKKANSRVRNALRRLVRGGLVDKLEAGNYKITAAGLAYEYLTAKKVKTAKAVVLPKAKTTKKTPVAGKKRTKKVNSAAASPP